MDTIEVLGYLNQYYTQTEISYITGVPQSTLSYAIRGLRDLPAKYNSVVYELKNSLAYSRLFNLGVPPAQAGYLSIQSVSDIIRNETYIEQIAEKLVLGYLTSTATDAGQGLSDQEYIDKYYVQAKNDILTALRSSTKPITEWADYLSDDFEV